MYNQYNQGSGYGGGGSFNNQGNYGGGGSFNNPGAYGGGGSFDQGGTVLDNAQQGLLRFLQLLFDSASSGQARYLPQRAVYHGGSKKAHKNEGL